MYERVPEPAAVSGWFNVNEVSYCSVGKKKSTFNYSDHN
jgi:hypothetical protein